MKQKIIGTGLSGLVGSRVSELLTSEFDFEDISRKTGTDILNKTEVLERVKNSDSPLVLHFAAYTNVDGAEEQKNLGEESESWKINVLGTQNVVDACRETHKKLIAISTDFVFSGNSTPENGYTEDDTPNPINWYGTTKYEGEKRITNSHIPWTILRIGFPYRASFPKNDFVRTFKFLLENKKDMNVVEDQIFTPTFIDDVAYVVQTVMKKSASGIFHVVGDTSLTVLDAALGIAGLFDLNKNLIHPTTREIFFAGKAQRPYNLTVNNDKIKSLGVTMKTFEQGLEEIKRQLEKLS